MIIQPFMGILCLWPWYSWDSQPLAGFLPWSTAGQAALMHPPFPPTTTPPLPPTNPPTFSLPLTSPDSTISPERNQTEAGEQEKWTRSGKAMRTVLFVLTPEQSEIMIVIVPLTSGGTWTLANQDMLICMHSPLGEEVGGSIPRFFFSLYEHTAYPSQRNLQTRLCLAPPDRSHQHGC